jgi:hypothetical protein
LKLKRGSYWFSYAMAQRPPSSPGPSFFVRILDFSVMQNTDGDADGK